MKFQPCSALEASRDGHVLKLATPWISLEIEYHDNDLPVIDRALRAITELKSSAALDWLLARLCHYPVCSVVPRKLTIREWLRGALQEPPLHSQKSRKLATRLGIQELLSSAAHGKNVLPVDEILALARKPGTRSYDALSLFTQLRVALCAYNTATEPERYEELFASSPSGFLKFAKIYIRQNHFVTTRAIDSLRPALAYKPFAHLLTKFIASEQGHDSLMWQSLMALDGLDPADIEILPEVQALVALLEFTATHYRLAFAVVLDLFERESPGEQHPLA
ncbi:MAG: hypothetical protein M3Q07_18985, partial [Pseudobdellovibrionaceae bacterium]|nr:hypothetical protein [Pseudobdellovibrionaceae bacterium]